LKKISFLLLFYFLLFSSLYANVYVYNEKDVLKSASELDYPPFSIVTKDKKADGFSVELLRSVLHAMGRDVEFYVDEWNSIKEDLKSGKVDVLPLVGRTPEREQYYDITIPYLTMHGTVFVRKDDLKIKYINDLKDKKIVVMKGDNADEYLSRHAITDTVIKTGSLKEAFMELSHGHCDAVIAQKLIGVQLIKELNISNIKTVDFILDDFEQDFSFAVKEGDKELLALLNEGLAIVKADGTYERLYQKWFSLLEEEKYDYYPIIYALFGFVLVLIIMLCTILLWQRTLKKKIHSKTRELRENQELYTNFFENVKSANVIYSTEDNGETFTIVDVNKAFENIENLNRDDIIGKKVHDLFKGAETSGIFDIFKEVYRDAKVFHMPVSLFSFGGKSVWRENYIFKLSTGNIVASYVDHTNEKELEIEQIKNYEQTLISLVDLIEHRDSYTGGHSLRVATYSRMVAVEMNCSQSECELIYRAGILHDIGKIITPDSILLKPSLLSDNEYELIQLHVTSGADMLEKIPMYKHMSEIVRAHHERLDGSGYPNQLKGEEIPKLALIMAVCDSFDAMTTNRIYKGRKTIEEAISELEMLTGSHYDRDVVHAAANVLSQVQLDDTITQLPISKIEQQRFSFFFRDQVTDSYNQNYLDIVLKKNQYDDEYEFLNIVLLHNFTQYNERYGWDKGDKLLNNVAQIIKQEFANAMVFRLHGDDFVVINKEHIDIDIEKIQQLCNLLENNISLELIHFHIQQDDITSIEKLEKSMFKHRREHKLL
jgi:putative nucleotidyltransferase with HDIG domain